MDPCLKEREFQLLKSDWLPNLTCSNTNVTNFNVSLAKSIPSGEGLFEETKLQELWDTAIIKD